MRNVNPGATPGMPQNKKAGKAGNFAGKGNAVKV